MADFGIYTKNADILARCGANANATAKATAATDIYVLDVEAFIIVQPDTIGVMQLQQDSTQMLKEF